ncbi:N-acetyl-gamma-glutamyl-phosphate reductase, partial [archaeon]|nr:N-acetyl-gamma-glutamyl-phosphate reductase [archaeon]
MVNVGIVGASGYTGGELLRLLVSRQDVSVTLATSRKHNGEYVFRVHPNLKSITTLKFSNPSIDSIARSCDYVFLAVPHGSAVNLVP